MHRLPGWSSNQTTRARRAPKLHLADSGVLGTYLDVDSHVVGSAEVGQLLGCFVAGELRRQLSWSETDVDLFHFRTQDGAEVDLVAEGHRGRLVGIEVRASVDIDHRAARGLRHLQQRHPDRFVAGVFLHCGTVTPPFGPGLSAKPLAAPSTV